MEEDRVVDFFASHLQNHGDTYYHKLVKTLCDSKLDIRNYFTCSSSSDKFKFFKVRPQTFDIGNDGYVSLAKEIDPSRDNSEEEAVIDYLVSVLETSQPIHYLHLALSLDAKDYFASLPSSDIYRFFKKRPSDFSLGEDGYVSLPEEAAGYVDECSAASSCSSKSEEQEEKIVEFFISTLEEFGPMHFFSLTELVSIDNEMKSYFANFTLYEKYWFFKNRSAYFQAGDNGFISLTTEKIERLLNKSETSKPKTAEETVVAFLISVLESHQPIHYLQLAQRLSSSSLDIKLFFETFSSSDVHLFFVNRPSCFSVERNGFIWLSKEHVESRIDVDDISSSASNGSLKWEEQEETVVELLVSTLEEFGAMHYLSLTELLTKGDHELKSYFVNFTLHEKCGFFENRPSHFFIGSDGFVSLPGGKAGSSLGVTSKLEPKTDEDAVLHFFVGQLKTYQPIHYLKLAYCLKSSNLDVKDYFATPPSNDIYWFFQNRPSHFFVQTNGYVSLRNPDDESLAVEISTPAENEVNRDDSCVERAVSIMAELGDDGFVALRTTEIGSCASSKDRDLERSSSPDEEWQRTADAEDVNFARCRTVQDGSSSDVLCVAEDLEEEPPRSGTHCPSRNPKISADSLQEPNATEHKLTSKPCERFLALMEKSLRRRTLSAVKCYQAFSKSVMQAFKASDTATKPQIRENSISLSQGELNDSKSEFKAIKFFIVVLSSFSTSVSARKLRAFLSDATDEVRQHIASNCDDDVLLFLQNNPRYFSVHRGRVALRNA